MLNFKEVGTGVPLVMIHGFPLAGEAFWPQWESPIEGVRFITPDLRGFGQSPPSTGTQTMEAMADDVLELMTALALPTAFIGGVSMGGYVAMALTRRDPSRVRGLVLVDTQATADDESARARRETTAKELELKGMGPLIEAMSPKLLGARTSPDVYARLRRIMSEVNPTAAAAATRGMALRDDSKDILARFGGPSLIVVGEADTITPPEKAKMMAELTRGTLEVMADAAHLPNLDQPAAFNAVLARFFAALTAF